MSTTIALIGAGGKMGQRVSRNLQPIADYRLLCVEVGEEGKQRLREGGFTVVDQEAVEAEADVFILAVPDRLIGTVADALIPRIRSGAIVIGLDPAAAYAGVLPDRDDITYFITHPCHPPLFGDSRPADKDTDWFGGVSEPQSIVCALHQGPEEHYATGEVIARHMFAPILRSHRITTEQMAVLEPAVVESTGICCVMVFKQAMDRAIEMGVPREAAWDFVTGHIRTELAIVFGFADFPFSDGAKKAVEQNLSIGLQCDRVEYGGRLEAFRFLGKKRLFPFTIYHLSRLFQRPVAFAFAGPERQSGTIPVVTSNVFHPGDHKDPQSAARNHFQEVLTALEHHLFDHPCLWFNFKGVNPEAPA